jgi:hypothetical protein
VDAAVVPAALVVPAAVDAQELLPNEELPQLNPRYFFSPPRYAVSVWCSAGVTDAPRITMRSMIASQLSSEAGLVVAFARS